MRRILLIVGGSIAAYKSYDLCRALIKSGHEVTILLSAGAHEFVNMNVFYYLGAKNVYGQRDDFFPQTHVHLRPVGHIELCRTHDMAVYVAATARSLQQLNGDGQHELTQSVFCAWDQEKPFLIFPAMNPRMWKNVTTQEAVNDLKKKYQNFLYFYGPQSSGILVCGDEGEGKLVELDFIVELIEIHLLSLLVSLETKNKNKNKTILITAGASQSPMDPVRYVTNSGSGLTAFYLAQFSLAYGFRVCVIAGLEADKRFEGLKYHPQFELERVRTPGEFWQATESFLERELKNVEAFIATASIGDFEFKIAEEKIKKSQDGIKLPEISLSPDTLGQTINFCQNKKISCKIIGFAAETQLTEEVLHKKWHKKPVDLLIGTKVGMSKSIDQKIIVEGFSQETAKYHIIYSPLKSWDKREETKLEISKKELSQIILKIILNNKLTSRLNHEA